MSPGDIVSSSLWSNVSMIASVLDCSLYGESKSYWVSQWVSQSVSDKGTYRAVRWQLKKHPVSTTVSPENMIHRFVSDITRMQLFQRKVETWSEWYIQDENYGFDPTRLKIHPKLLYLDNLKTMQNVKLCKRIKPYKVQNPGLVGLLRSQFNIKWTVRELSDMKNGSYIQFWWEGECVSQSWWWAEEMVAHLKSGVQRIQYQLGAVLAQIVWYLGSN